MLELNLRPDERTLRRFGFIAAVAFGCLAWWVDRGSSWGAQTMGEAARPLAFALAAVAISCALFSVVAPRANRALFVALTLLSFPIGLVVSHLVLVALFFVIITPTALVMRAVGRDRLKRSYDPRATSYWEPARPAPSKAAYFKQY